MLNKSTIILFDTGNISVGIPQNTTIQNQLKYSFTQLQDYTSGVMEVTVEDQEGGIKIGFNNEELKTLIFDDNQTFTYTIKIPLIKKGTNLIQIWSQTGDGQTLKRIVVKQGVPQNIVRKDTVNKILHKIQKLYSFYKGTKEGIGNLPPIPKQVWQKEPITKSKIDELKNLINTLYGQNYSCYYYNDNIINDEILNQLYQKITNQLPQSLCYSCDYYTPCQCDGSCHNYSGCSCDNLCNGYSNCSCYVTCYQEQCNCNSKQYDKCSCYNTIYSTNCRCYISKYEINCSCNSKCHGYSGCSCNNTCNGYSCSCHNKCHGYSSCSCNNSTYGYSGCSCNNTCHGYSDCSCVMACHGYSGCSCNNKCYNYKTTCGCYNTCYIVSG